MATNYLASSSAGTIEPFDETSNPKTHSRWGVSITDPELSSIVLGMSASYDDLFPPWFRSAGAGNVFERNPAGTDSVAFGNTDRNLFKFNQGTKSSGIYVNTSGTLLRLPPKVRLYDKDNASGQYLRVERMTGKKRVTGSDPYDDTRTVIFKEETLVYPEAKPQWLIDKYYQSNELTGTLTATGKSRPGLIDGTFDITQKEESYTPFKESNLVEQHSGSKDLRGKTAIRIDISNSEERVITRNVARRSDSIDSSGEFAGQDLTGFCYFNTKSKRWEQIGLADPGTGNPLHYDWTWGSSSNTGPITMSNNFPSQFTGGGYFQYFTNENNQTRGRYSCDLFSGYPHMTNLAPTATKYHATSSQTIKLSKYIARPFVVTDIVLDLPVVVSRSVEGYHASASLSRRVEDLFTFFIYHQINTNKESLIADVSSSIRHLVASGTACFYPKHRSIANTETVDTQYEPIQNYSFSHRFDFNTSSAGGKETLYYDKNLTLRMMPAIAASHLEGIRKVYPAHNATTESHVYGIDGHPIISNAGSGLSWPGGSSFHFLNSNGFFKGTGHGENFEGYYPYLSNSKNSSLSRDFSWAFEGISDTSLNGTDDTKNVFRDNGVYARINPRFLDISQYAGEANSREFAPPYLTVIAENVVTGSDTVEITNYQISSVGTGQVNTYETLEQLKLQTFGEFDFQRESRYLLTPSDELILGIDFTPDVDVKYGSLGNVHIASGSINEITSSNMKIKIGEASLTLYGHELSDDSIFVEGIQQNLTTPAIHESLQFGSKVTDQFSVWTRSELTGTFIDTYMDPATVPLAASSSLGKNTRNRLYSAGFPPNNLLPHTGSSHFPLYTLKDETESFIDSISQHVSSTLNTTKKATSAVNYGKISNIEKPTQGVWRFDKYGQYSDMLEQRLFSRMRINKIELKTGRRISSFDNEGPVFVRFISTGSGLPIKPEETDQVRNLSAYSTSSTSYIDV